MRSTRWSRIAAGRRNQLSICGIVPRNHSPNTKRPSSFPNCFTCSGSLAARKRSASWKNAFSFCRSAAMPCSISSTRTRFSLSARCLAIVSTCFAILGGSVTLRRTCLERLPLVAGMMTPLYTKVVRAPDFVLSGDGKPFVAGGDSCGRGFQNFVDVSPEEFSVHRLRFSHCRRCHFVSTGRTP